MNESVKELEKSGLSQVNTLWGRRVVGQVKLERL